MIRYFAGHPTIANLLMIAFLAAGLFVAPTLLRETFPRSAQSEVEITVPYPGARPEDVESAICERLENALDSVTGLQRYSCEARESLARGPGLWARASMNVRNWSDISSIALTAAHQDSTKKVR